MKNFFAIFTIMALFLNTNTYAQDSLQIRSKKQYHYKTQKSETFRWQSGSLKDIGFVVEKRDVTMTMPFC